MRRMVGSAAIDHHDILHHGHTVYGTGYGQNKDVKPALIKSSGILRVQPKMQQFHNLAVLSNSAIRPLKRSTQRAIPVASVPVMMPLPLPLKCTKAETTTIAVVVALVVVGV
jgi:hypothetical protein